MIKERFFTKAQMRTVVFLAIGVLCLLTPNLSYADLPDNGDYQCNVSRIEYIDEVNRHIISDFSTDTFEDEDENISGYPMIYFSDTSVISRAASEGGVNYRFFSYKDDDQQGTLHLSGGTCTLGLEGTEDNEDNAWGTFPLNFGEEAFRDHTLEVEFTAFKNVDFSQRSQKIWDFGFNFSEETPVVDCGLEATWFNGTYDGKDYDKAIIFQVEVGNQESELVFVENRDPNNDTVSLRLKVKDNGWTVEGQYKINTGPWETIATIDAENQVTAYPGNVPSVGLGYGTEEDSGDDSGYLVASELWIKAIIQTEEKGPIEAVWKKGGEDTTSAGDRVIWGHFYASPDDVTWGSENNPDLFVKIWFDHYGRLDVNFFHVSVPDIVVYSDYPYDGTSDEQGTTTMSTRYIRQYYEGGQSYSTEQTEDGNPPSGYSQTGNPSGYSTINDLRIGAMINTIEKGLVDAVWHLGGQDTTSAGDQVVWGHFYANPNDVTWGSSNNPDLFMKIWFDVSGRVDVNFFHVSVPDIEVYSDLPSDGAYDQEGTTVMDNRYIRHEYWR